MITTRQRRTGFAFVASLALVLAACGDDSDDPVTADPADEPDAEPAEDGEDVEIGVSFYDNQVIPLYVDMEESMTETAGAAGASVRFSYANFDPAAQVDQIEQYITQGVDVILVTPFDRNTLVPAYEAARDAGIPIISFANKVDDEHEDGFVGRDWAEMGGLMMEAINDELDGSGSVALITGPPEIDVARQVSEGWQTVLDANPGLEVTDELVDPDMSRERGLDLANTLLAANPDVDAIACTIDLICLGAVQAIDEQGLDHADIFVASMDADVESVEQVRAGEGIDFTVSMKGLTWGEQVMDVAIDWVRGNQPSEHMVPSEYFVVDAESIETLTDDDLR